ncbi:MAG TPA: hypothetical protein VF062_01820 [Candidatus Limnocylindrales bacterium]
MHSHDLSRRGVLAAGVGAAGILLTPSIAHADESLATGDDPAVPHHDVETAGAPGQLDIVPLAMTQRNSINGTPLYYEPTRARATFTFDQTFYDQLVAWRNQLGTLVPDSWGGPPTRIYSYGAYVNKPGMHGLGRGFDLASVNFTGTDGDFIKGFDCRYDQWRDGSAVTLWRRRYWTLSASLHHRFKHVLTYVFNAEHHNHIHVDNDGYGSNNSASFSTGSSAQVQHVQAVCRYLWGYSTTIDGSWGSQTQSHSTAVLRRIGYDSGTITSDSLNWRAFNRYSVLHGSGKQTF